MKGVRFRKFSELEHRTWQQLFDRQTPRRAQQIVEVFSQGLELLKIGPERIPELDEVNAILHRETGFMGVAVEGLESADEFFPMLARREFPIGNFIRDPKDLAYTPAPDVFHDLYGHLPFFVDPAYADFCYYFGVRASRYVKNPRILRQFDRLFWFTIEFALIKTPVGRRIFGAGITSSFSECEFALSDQPEVLPFDLEVIRHQEFRIDDFQRRLFLLENEAQLYSCLEEFEAGISRVEPVAAL